MTQAGIIHLLSLIYLSAVICLAVSVNENRGLRRIVRETARRWLKFMVVILIIAVVVSLISR
ncbi:MAG: hypothetical protein M1457_00735 [bacterium]|nr:hypothetical protein [bacterium]